jgi:hypothetical protein
MKKIIILIAFASFIFCQPTLASEISKEKKVLIDKLLEQTGQSATIVGKQFSNAYVQQMTVLLEKSNPDIDPKAFKIIKEELNKMIEFNDTPLGKKIVTVTPLIAQEGMQAGQTFAQSLVPKIKQRVFTRLKEEGININNYNEPIK